MAKKKPSIFPDQPAEINILAGKEVVLVEKPSATLSTSVHSEAAEDAREESDMDQFAISPYAYAPVVIDCGPGLASYHVPKHLLRSPKWSTTDAGGIVQLPDVSAATGHTLVHYLYTGIYQPLEAKGTDVASPAQIKFEQALMAFVLASAYELPDFERLAKEQIDIIGGSMTLDEVLHTAKKWFSKIARSWFHEYLLTRAKEQFSLDYRYFTRKAYMKSVGDGKLQSFMAHYLLEAFTEKLNHALRRAENHCLGEEGAEVVVDGVEDEAGRSEVSFEFVNASREDTVAVISLEDQTWDDKALVRPESAAMPSPGPLTESEAQPNLAPDLPPAEEWIEHKEREKEERLAKEDEENQEEATVTAEAAAAASQAADLSWADETPANDDWGSLAATTTGKKKKGTKGKAQPTPRPPPPPAEPPTTFDDIKLDHVNLNDGATKIDMNFGDSVAAKSGSGFALSSLRGCSSNWGSSNKTSGWGLDDSSKEEGGDNPWGSDQKKKDSNAFEFDLDVFKGASEAAPPAEEKPPEDDGWGFGVTTIRKKKGKKGALIDESVPEPEAEKKEEDDPWAFSFGSTGKDKKKKKKGVVEEPSPEPELEPVQEPTPPPSEPEPEPVKEQPAVDPFAGLSKSQKKKLQENIIKEVKAKAKEDAKRKEEEEAAEVVRQAEQAEAEQVRLEEEEAEKKRIGEEEEAAAAAAAEAEKKKDNTWGDWGAATTTTKKKKKKKGSVEEEPPPPPPLEPVPEPEPVVEPELEPVPEPEPVKEEDPWGFAATTGKKKKKRKGAVEEEPPPPPPVPEPEPLIGPEPSPPAEKKPADGWDDWGAATTTTKKKKKKKKGVVEEEKEECMHGSVPETSRVLCPRRSAHFAEVDDWKSCERCRAMVKAFAAQLEKEEKAMLLPQ